MIQIGTGTRERPLAEEPITFLFACHGRILERLATLERIAAALETDPASALEALRNTLRFFDLSGRLHTEDEEVSVFPRLRGAISAEEIAALDNLEHQHREKESVYGEIVQVSEELRSAVTTEPAARFRALVARLAHLYRAHIAVEEEVLTRAAGRLTADDLHSIREEIRRRRQNVS